LFNKIIIVFRSVFSSYFVGLTLFSSFFLSYVYPHIITHPNIEFKKEYRIGQFIGYIYAGGALIGIIITKLFG